MGSVEMLSAVFHFPAGISIDSIDPGVNELVCGTPTCPRRIFTERLPGLVQSYARMTTRLIVLLQALGLAAGGQLGTRLADRSAIATSPSTLLRHLMQLPPAVARAVRVLG